MSEQIGYIRVSSIGQNTERQLEGVSLNKEFIEKVSAKDTRRPQLAACLDYLRTGDTLHVHSIDRLARNLEDLQKIVKQCTSKGAVVHFHKENLIFSGAEDPVQVLLFQMLGAVAQFERALIKERQLEGIAVAKAKGKHLGRPILLSLDQQQEVIEKRKAGLTPSQLSKQYNISRATVYRITGSQEQTDG